MEYRVIRFIGDVHCKFADYLEIIKKCDRSVQVGDFGAGFAPLPVVSVNHRFIRGNHDNPEICKNSANWIKDVTYEDGIYFVGGAYSVDQANRTMGVDWLDDEQLSFKELGIAIDIYEKVKPRIVVTHDAPESIMSARYPWIIRNRTAQAFDAMFEIHQPELWIFGHYHKSMRFVENGTKFICLSELEYIDL